MDQKDVLIIPYSTEDGYFEEALYRFTGNGAASLRLAVLSD